MQGDSLDAVDDVVTTPLVARPVRTGHAESMQHREKYGTFHGYGKQLMKSRKKLLLVGTTLLSSGKTRSRIINRLQDKIAQKWPPTVEEKLDKIIARLIFN